MPCHEPTCAMSDEVVDLWEEVLMLHADFEVHPVTREPHVHAHLDTITDTFGASKIIRRRCKQPESQEQVISCVTGHRHRKLAHMNS